MRVVVGGGTGFIGSALVHALVDRGDKVTVLARRPETAERQFGGSVTVRTWNPPTPGEWVHAVDGTDAVINLAGLQVVDPLKPWTRSYRAAVLASRVDSTAVLVEAVRRAKTRPSVMINQSAIGYYGSRGSEVLTEDSSPGDGFLSDVVKQWEGAALPIEEMGVRLVLPRTGMVLGNRGGLLPQFELPFRLFLGGTMGYPDQWFSWIHLRDEVDIIIHALSHDDVRGAVNATAPNPVTMREFSRALGAALHRPSWIPFMWAGMKVGLGRRSSAVLSSERVVPAALQRLGYRFSYPDLGPALRSLTATTP